MALNAKIRAPSSLEAMGQKTQELSTQLAKGAAPPSGRAISLRAPVVGFVLELPETRPEGAVVVANSIM